MTTNDRRPPWTLAMELSKFSTRSRLLEIATGQVRFRSVPNCREALREHRATAAQVAYLGGEAWKRTS